MRIFFMFDDATAGSEGTFTESSDDGLENGVAVGAVHCHFESCFQRNSIPRLFQPEVRNRRLSFGIDGVQRAVELSGRMKDAGNAVEYTQIRIIEDITSIERR